MPFAFPRSRSSLFLRLLAVLACLPAAPAHALQIAASFTDLDDGLGPGGDFWEVQLQPLDPDLARYEGFTVYFGAHLYSDLRPTVWPTIGPWDPVLVQPDPGLPAPGFLQGVANTEGPQLAIVFRVLFVWLGVGTPGAQLFERSQFDANGGLIEVLETGTTSVVPEPALLALLVPAILVLRRRD